VGHYIKDVTINTRVRKRYRFKPKLLPTLLLLILLAFFITLAVWQLHRYRYKKELLQQFQDAASAQPIGLSQINKFQDIRFRHIRVRGHYINKKSMLIQHRRYQEQPGFDVLTPFEVEGSQKILLVNRGWVPMQSNRQSPALQSIYGIQTIVGTIKTVSHRSFILGKNILNPSKWPLIMQKINISEISKLTQYKLYPFILRLDANQANGFVRDWKVVTTKPERHLGYALQWFGLGFVLIIVYLFSIRKKV